MTALPLILDATEQRRPSFKNMIMTEEHLIHCRVIVFSSRAQNRQSWQPWLRDFFLPDCSLVVRFSTRLSRQKSHLPFFVNMRPARCYGTLNDIITILSNNKTNAIKINLQALTNLWFIYFLSRRLNILVWILLCRD